MEAALCLFCRCKEIMFAPSILNFKLALSDESHDNNSCATDGALVEMQEATGFHAAGTPLRNEISGFNVEYSQWPQKFFSASPVMHLVPHQTSIVPLSSVLPTKGSK
jgi:hypothetical protein